MAINPLPFIANMPDPGQAFMQSFQAARQQRDQKQQQEQRQYQLQGWMARLKQDRSPQTMAEFALAFPEMADAVNKAYEPLDAQVKQSRLNYSAQVYSALQQGDTARAKEIAQGLLDAAKNTPGQEQYAKELEFGIEMLDKNPDALKTGLAIDIATQNPKLYETLFKKDEEKPYVVVPGVGLVLRRDIDAAIAAGEKGVSGATVRPSVPQGAIDMLKKNPALKPQFDAKYGVGAADSILGGGSGNATGGFRP